MTQTLLPVSSWQRATAYKNLSQAIPLPPKQLSAVYRCWRCTLIWEFRPGPTDGCPHCGFLWSTWLNMSDFGIAPSLLNSCLVAESEYRKSRDFYSISASVR